MQCVILAAGRGTRMGNLTEVTPKPLLQAGNRTLLEHKLDQLPDEIDEVVIVVGYLNHKIREHLGTTYKGLPISYAEQKELNGTAGAVYAAKHLLHDRFIVMMGDDIYTKGDFEECLKHNWAINAKKIVDQERGGELLLDIHGNLRGIDEPKHHIKEGLLNSGLYMMQKSFFDYDMVEVGNTGEYGIPHTLVSIAKTEPVSVVITNDPWIQITNKEDIENFKKSPYCT
jgi:NDP-sugar pyrophosphorylase family protein